MTTIDTHIKVKKTGPLSSFLTGKTFESDYDLIETIEDFLLGKSMEKSDIGDFDLDFRLLEEHEISDDLRAKFEKSKKLSDEHFIDVTKKYASYFQN